MSSVHKQVAEVCLCMGGRKFGTGDILTNFGEQDYGKARNAIYRLTRTGVLTRVRKYPGIYRRASKQALKQEIARKNRKKDCGWDKLWRASRVMLTFRAEDLAIATGESAVNTRSFLTKYTRLGYLIAMKDKAGTQWRLVRNPGPVRPVDPVAAKEAR